MSSPAILDLHDPPRAAEVAAGCAPRSGRKLMPPSGGVGQCAGNPAGRRRGYAGDRE